MQLNTRTWWGLRLAAAAPIAVLTLLATSCTSDAPTEVTPQPPPAMESQTDCDSDSQPLRFDLSNGSSWELCWSIAADVGLTLTNVTFVVDDQRTQVLDEAALAQIHVPYDDGSIAELDMPVFGLNTATLDSSLCDGEILATESGSLCSTVIDDNLRYAWSDYDFGTGNHSGRGQCLRLFTLTPVSWYSYVNQWLLCDDGRIVPSVGAGGKLAPQFFGDSNTGVALGPGEDDNRLSHFHNIFWRLRFALEGSQIERVTYTPEEASVVTSSVVMTQEFAARQEPRTSWRVSSRTLLNGDHHAVGYDLEVHNPAPYPHKHENEFTAADIYGTEFRACERLAANNPASSCATSVDMFANGENLTDPVVWVQVGFHHLPRDEDQPVMDEHWQGFSMTPRGLTESNPRTDHLE